MRGRPKKVEVPWWIRPFGYCIATAYAKDAPGIRFSAPSFIYAARRASFHPPQRENGGCEAPVFMAYLTKENPGEYLSDPTARALNDALV
jgi:hypothetical protein